MTVQARIVRALRATLAALALAVIGTGFAAAQSVPTVTIAATQSSPFSPANVTVTWSSTNAAACVASGAWSGSKAPAGSQSFTAVKQSQTYTLTCSAASGSALVTWSPPTEWVDGDPMPAGEPDAYEIWHHTAAAVEDGAKLAVKAPASSATVTGLPAGLRYFGVKAISLAGVSSDLSNIDSKTVSLPSASASASVTVQRKPRPPVQLAGGW